MCQEQLVLFKQLLHCQLEILNENVLQTNAHLQDSTDLPDPIDRATKEELQNLELKTRDRERKLKRKIEQTIRRIESGSYGYCEESGEEIGIARLLARPTATLCIDAQTQHEKRERQFNS